MLENLKSNVVIFHDNCIDGAGSAFCFYHAYGDKDFSYIPLHYRDEDDIDFTAFKDRFVYLVDFCFKREKLLELIDIAGHVCLLDHHKTALIDIEDIGNSEKFDKSHSSLNYSGAMLSYRYLKNYLFIDEMNEIENLIKHIQDHDLYKFELENTLEIATGLSTYNYYDYSNFYDEQGLENIITQGKAMMRGIESVKNSVLSAGVRIVNIAGYNVPIVNALNKYADIICNEICKGYPFAIVYYDTPQIRSFSLRSDENGVDVGKIAFELGGGGHFHSAGFSIPLDNILLPTLKSSNNSELDKYYGC